MAQFASLAELEAFLQTTYDGAAAVAADQALTMASASIQNETHQRIEAVANEVVTFAVRPRTYRLFLPELPVTGVSAVTIDGVALLVTDYIVDSQTGVMHRRYLVDWARTWESTVAVTYSHGYAVIPDDIKQETLRRAADLMDNPSTMDSETIGNYAYRRATGSNGDDSTSSTVDRYRVISVA